MSKLRHTIEICGRIAQKYGLEFNPNGDTIHFWRVMKKNKQTQQMYAVALAISKEAVRVLERGIEGSDECPPIHFEGEIEHFDGTSCVIKGKAELVTGEVDREYTDVGEANKANCTIAYPAAMAWKRAKQRCVLGILGLDGVYSEEESDDFKQTDQGYAETTGPATWGGTPHQAPIQPPQGPPQQGGYNRQPTQAPQQQPQPQPQQHPNQHGGGGQQFPPAKEPQAYVQDIEQGAEPPLNPWSMTFNKGKFQGWTWVEAFKAAHAEQMQKGGPIEDNYIRWYCREFGPSAIARKFSKPPTDFQIKMWATLLWMLRWVDPVTGQKKTEQPPRDPAWTQPPPQQVQSMDGPGTVPPSQVDPHHNWEEGRNEPSLMDEPGQTPHPQGNFGVPYPGQNLGLPHPGQPNPPEQPMDETPF